MTLEYLREYRTYFSLGQIYDLSEANTYKIVKKVEDILIKSKEFRLPNRKEVYENPNIEAIVVDAAESIIKRPKKNKGNTTRERKRSIPIKAQIIINFKDKRILKTNFSNGKKHDFRLFKESNLIIPANVQILADTGYQGIQKIHINSIIPFKRKRNKTLTTEQSKFDNGL